MADLFTILKVTVGPKKLTARVLVNPGMPLFTRENVEATARVYYLAPAIAEHVCLGDTGPKFQDCMGNTEVAHLLEHLTVEIMNETGLAGDVSTGRTRGTDLDERLFDIELSCPDDALVIGALSSATFMMNWAFLAPEQTPPDFPGTVAALRSLVLSLRGETEGASGVPGVASGEAEGAAPFAEDAMGFAMDAPNGGVIDTEGAAVVAREDAADAVFGGAAGQAGDVAASAPRAAEAPYDDAAALDPGATAAMPTVAP